MPNKVVHFKSIGPVTFFRSRRSKSMKISVRPDKSVLVSFPVFVTEKEIMWFLAKNEAWILKHQKKACEKRTRFSQGMLIHTKRHTIELSLHPTPKVDIRNDVVRFQAPEFQSEKVQNDIEHLIVKIYRVEAQMMLPPRLEELAGIHGFSYSKVTIRNNKRNWGSCSSRNNISLNLQMMKLPDELIDYILLHELVHTQIKDHSERFWNRLDQLTQNRARELAREVKKYSTYIV